MTSKHFVALADALREEKPGENWDPNKKVQWEQDVKAVARVCRMFNPRFDEGRFWGYINGECGPRGGRK